MTRATVLQQIYLSKEFNNLIQNIDPKHIRDDLKSEVMLVLCEMNEHQLMKIKDVVGYACKMVVNMGIGGWNGFHKKYRREYTEVEDSGEEVCFDDVDNKVELCPSIKCVLNGRVVKEEREDKLVKVVEGLYWYDAAMLKLYVEKGSFRKIEKDTGIPWESAYKTVRKAIKKIKQHVEL